MIADAAQTVFIIGLSQAGKPFRPSDWAERLAGVMSQFRPGDAPPGRHLGYSPWCVPSLLPQALMVYITLADARPENVKCVIVQRALRDTEALAWDFCLNFARDNDLQLLCLDAQGQRV